MDLRQQDNGEINGNGLEVKTMNVKEGIKQQAVSIKNRGSFPLQRLVIKPADSEAIRITRDITFEEFGHWWKNWKGMEDGIKRGTIMYKYTGLPWTPECFTVVATFEKGEISCIEIPSDAVEAL